MRHPSDSHAPIRALVERIRRETGKDVPRVDPTGPGTKAWVVLVLIAPSRPGALETGVLSQENPDATARNQRRLFKEAGLDPGWVTFWNAVPWEVGDRPKPTVADIRAGAPYIAELIALMEGAPSVVAMGRVPQRGCRLAGVDAFEAPNPSPLGLFGGGANRWDDCREALALAVQQARRLHSTAVPAVV